MEQFFSPNSSGHLRSDAHQSQIIGGNADVRHTQTIGGDTTKLLGSYILPGFGTPAPALCLLFNACFENGFFPTCLKEAKVVPVFKSGDRRKLTNCRPISILY